MNGESACAGTARTRRRPSEVAARRYYDDDDDDTDVRLLLLLLLLPLTESNSIRLSTCPPATPDRTAR